MQKKLEAELMSIAHQILQMKNRDDLKALKQKAYETYEKLAVLSYMQDYVKETPQNTKSVEELVAETFSTNKEIKAADEVAVDEPVMEETVKTETVTEEETIVEQIAKEEPVENNTEEELQVVVKKEITEVSEEILTEEVISKKDSPLDLFTKVTEKENKETTNLQTTLEKEFGTTVSLDVATDMFENATRVATKKSINDVAMNQKNLQIDLNDRIAFVKHLFDGSQEDFNRVISQLNTMTSEKEALSFLKMIKKEYHWSGKEVYEDRLSLLIERKFN